MRFVAVTSCPTGIAHTYMAAEALEQAGKAAGHDVQVETQGSAGSSPLDPAVIAAADGVIFAADLEVKDRDRFAGKPTVDVGVKKAVHDAPGVLAQAIAAVETGPVATPTANAPAAPTTKVDKDASVGTRVRQWLMTGISYMIPFVAAGGILIALAFMLAGVAWDQNGAVEVTKVPVQEIISGFDAFDLKDWAVLLNAAGGAAFGFLVPVLAGFIAYAIADRPGLVPGFVGGSIAVTVGAGFLGGLVAGFIGGFLALWISRWKVPKGMRGIMPVVVIPLLSTFVTGLLMLVVLGRPLAALMDGLTSWLNGLTGANLILLGAIIGLMMGFDLGGPVNKVAYTFGVTGLSTVGLTAGATEYRVMAAVMAAGMVAPLAMALASTVLAKKLFTHAEQENGKAAWLLGASFISEGAIPFAAVDPFRVLPASMIGSAATGALIMAFDASLQAPHGGIWVLPLIGNPLGFLAAVVIGTAVSAVVVIALKKIGRNTVVEAERAADELAAA